MEVDMVMAIIDIDLVSCCQINLQHYDHLLLVVISTNSVTTFTVTITTLIASSLMPSCHLPFSTHKLLKISMIL